MEHPSRPVESTTGPCPTNSERCRTPHTKSFPAPSLHHTTHYIMRYMDKSKIKRRKICRGKPILAQVSFPAWPCGRLVVVHPRMVVSLYNLISSVMEDHNNVTIKNMSVTSTSFLWYASRRKCVTFWCQLYESNIKSCHQLSNILRWCPASKEEMTNHSSSYFRATDNFSGNWVFHSIKFK